QMGPIGYSPLPVNLVQASFQQVNKLKSADHGVDLHNENVTTCHNPTFIAGHLDVNCLAKIAPPPPPCDHNGAGPCATDSNRQPRGQCVNLNTTTGGGKHPVHVPGGGNAPGGGTVPSGTGPAGTAPGATAPAGTNPTAAGAGTTAAGLTGPSS